jgi:hypothetical protein
MLLRDPIVGNYNYFGHDYVPFPDDNSTVGESVSMH